MKMNLQDYSNTKIDDYARILQSIPKQPQDKAELKGWLVAVLKQLAPMAQGIEHYEVRALKERCVVHLDHLRCHLYTKVNQNKGAQERKCIETFNSIVSQWNKCKKSTDPSIAPIMTGSKNTFQTVAEDKSFQFSRKIGRLLHTTVSLITRIVQPIFSLIKKIFTCFQKPTLTEQDNDRIRFAVSAAKKHLQETKAHPEPLTR
ncbi:MAG: hypothetical protein K0S07_1561, partial [Chlamydiales bacterium]|nr:hypothetical protein [Chlamydiales bacterium]